LGSGDKNGPKRCQMRRLGMGIFFLFFFDSNLLFNIDIGSIDVLKGPRGLRWVAMTKTGPNDASGVVWVIGSFFSFFFRC